MSEKSSNGITVIGLCGSLREKSLNSALLRAAAALAPAGLRIERASFADFPIYNADVQDRGFPRPVQTLGDRLRAADALLIVSPEYNYSIPGGLKNAIDWLSRLPDQPFAGKLVAIMGASPGRIGTARMQYHLRQSFVFLDGAVLNRPEVMVGGAAAAFDESGQLIDPEIKKLVSAQLEALAKAVRTQRRGAPTVAA